MKLVDGLLAVAGADAWPYCTDDTNEVAVVGVAGAAVTTAPLMDGLLLKSVASSSIFGALSEEAAAAAAASAAPKRLPKCFLKWVGYCGEAEVVEVVVATAAGVVEADAVGIDAPSVDDSTMSGTVLPFSGLSTGLGDDFRLTDCSVFSTMTLRCCCCCCCCCMAAAAMATRCICSRFSMKTDAAEVGGVG